MHTTFSEVPMDAPAAPEPKTFRLAFAGLLLAMLLGSLDQTIVSTALPTIVRDLGGLDQLSWVVTAYLLGATVSMPLWGRASDVHGRKRLFVAAITVFLAGSALSGLAGSLGQLIAFRALQGLGAGGLMTLAMALVAEIVPPRERGRYQGYIQMIFVAASVAGPLLGGVLTDHASWRWIFYVNLPIGAAVLALVSVALDVPAQRGEARVDYLGAALLAGALTCLLLFTTWGGQGYAWGSAEIVGLGIGALSLFVAWVVQQRRAAEPILPLRLFANPVFTIVSGTLFCATLAFFAVIVFIPVFLQVVTGASATGSGLLLLPLLLASTASTMVAGRVMSATGRYKLFPVTGLALMAVGLVLLAQMDAGTSRAAVSLLLILFGIGFGMVSQILTVALQNAVERRDLGIATASANLVRSLGGSIGVAVFGAVFAGRLDRQPGEVAGLDPAAVADALQPVFLVAAPFALAGFLVVLLLRETPAVTAPAAARSAR
jgi:EmrB/QacA subfamily drug resistance transporter